MRILLTNDDGIESPGIHILAKELMEVADVFLAAPEEERSGSGHSLTLGVPVMYSLLDPATGLAGCVVRGTPVDCVRLAHEVLDERFDMVVSGINTGANVGLNIHYSGTVAAALEAAFLGRMGLAVSISSRRPDNYETAAKFGARTAESMLRTGVPRVVNLNVPDLPVARVRGVRVTKTCLTEKETVLAMSENCPKIDDECGGDEFVLDSRAVAAGFVSVTPLQLDMTAHDMLRVMQEWEWKELDR